MSQLNFPLGNAKFDQTTCFSAAIRADCRALRTAGTSKPAHMAMIKNTKTVEIRPQLTRIRKPLPEERRFLAERRESPVLIRGGSAPYSSSSSGSGRDFLAGFGEAGGRGFGRLGEIGFSEGTSIVSRQSLHLRERPALDSSRVYTRAQPGHWDLIVIIAFDSEVVPEKGGAPWTTKTRKDSTRIRNESSSFSSIPSPS